MIASTITVKPFPVVFTVLSLVIADVFLVLLNIGSLAHDDPFPVDFVSFFSDGVLESQRSLFAIVFAGPGFTPCSLHNIVYGRHSYKQPYCHFPVID